jgi:ribosome biogenesis GTPase A
MGEERTRGHYFNLVPCGSYQYWYSVSLFHSYCSVYCMVQYGLTILYNKDYKMHMMLNRTKVLGGRLSRYLPKLTRRRIQALPFQSSSSFFTTTSSTSNTNIILDPDLLTSPEPIAIPKKCNGCGSIFQHNDALKPGYVPLSKFTDFSVGSSFSSTADFPDSIDSAPSLAISPPPPSIICQRCFHLTHYGDTSAIDKEDPLTREVRSKDDIVEHIKWIETFPPTALCIKVVDALDLHGTIVPQLVGALRTRRVLLVVNKADVLPTTLTAHELQIYVRKLAKEAGIRNVVGCVASSAIRGKHGITALTKEIRSLRNGRSVYLVGVANVGKSTLFNELKLNNVLFPQTSIASTSETAPKDKDATVSSLPGTTISPLKVRFGTGSSRWDMYDTPGIVVNRKKHDMLRNVKLRKELLQNKTIKPKTFSVKGGTTLFFGGMGRIDVSFDHLDHHEPLRTTPRLLLIWNGHMNVHSTSTKNVDRLMNKQMGKLLSPALYDGSVNNNRGGISENEPLTLLLKDNVWDLSSVDDRDNYDNFQDLYDERSFRVSGRKLKKGQRQRTPFVDIDMGGFGWLTIATSYDDYMSLTKRIDVLQRANVSIWGHSFLKPIIRSPLIPNQAGELRSKDWTTV